MPRLLRAVLCVIETFHKYAREDGGQATAKLSYAELTRLIQGEFGDAVQPAVIRVVERNLHLPDLDSDGTIGFEEFVLAIFNLVNLCHLDIRSFLNPEPRQVCKPEGDPDGTDGQAAGRTGQGAEGPPPAAGGAVLPSGTASSAQLSPGERGCDRVDPQGDAKTHNLPGDASGHGDLGGDERGQTVTQAFPETGDKGAQIETKKPKAGSEQTDHPTEGAGQGEVIPPEGDKPVRGHRDTEARDQFGGQEGNVGTPSSPSEGTAPGPLGQQGAPEDRGAWEPPDAQAQPLLGDGEPLHRDGEPLHRDGEALHGDGEPLHGDGEPLHGEAQPLLRDGEPLHGEGQPLLGDREPLHGDGEPGSQHADLQPRTAAQVAGQTQESPDPTGDGQTSETWEPGREADRSPPEANNSAGPEEEGRAPVAREPPAQEKGRETKGLSVPDGSGDRSETPGAGTKETAGRGPIAQEGERQGPREGERQGPREGERQGPREPALERSVEEGAETPEPCTEGGDQEPPETEGAAAPGDGARPAEEGPRGAPASPPNAPAAEGAPGAHGGTWALSALEDGSGGETQRVTKTHDKPVEGGDGDCGETPLKVTLPSD